MLCSVLFFGTFGTVTLCIQFHKIWSGKSAKSLSGSAVIVLTAFFAAFAIYGLSVGNKLTAVHGSWRAIFWAPIAIGFVLYGRATMRHLALGLLCLTMLVCMYSASLRGPILYAFTFMSIYFALVQAYTIVVNKARGKVSLLNQILPHVSATTWVVYGAAIGDKSLAITSALSAASYLAIIIAWVKYPNPPQPAVTA